MKTPVIKICGITRAQDIKICNKLNVEYIGLNFVPGSPRCLNIQEAKGLKDSVTRSLLVGVFADQDIGLINEYVAELDLDYVQLHGKEPVALLSAINASVIKAFRSIPDHALLEAFIAEGAKVMVDGRDNGIKADWNAASALPKPIKEQLFLAGGLTPENVSEAIEQVAPYAVDVASGVEREPGIKDAKKMKTFMQTVHGAEL